MIGKIFITSSGYDPQLGKHVKDPYLGDQPSLGACRPDIRRCLEVGDNIFVISGKIASASQYVMGGFAIREKISAQEAFKRFPEQRLRLRPDGQLDGNVIVDRTGRRHALDTHNPEAEAFFRRIQNYVVGKDPIVISRPEEIALARRETTIFLRDLLERPGTSPVEIVGRWGTTLDERQVIEIRRWLSSLKARC